MQMQRGLPQAGAVVADKYVIARLLGRGGMGAVYVVEHRLTGKRLALKCLLPEHLEQPEFVERFLREAQAAGRIQHRNVVDVFDVGQDGELLYIVMELLDGKPLSELLREAKLSLEETLRIVLRAMQGVAAAHQVGIVHRDLKPDNIFVCVGQSGELDDPRVLDFGISKLEDDASKPLTKSGVMLGTPYYMAFEQINSQRDLDQRVDVYAMGVILYEAIAGQPPYVAESVGALAIRMMSGPPAPLRELRPDLPEELTAVVMRSIARDRDQRFPTMQALIEALGPHAGSSASLLTPRGQGTPLGGSLRSAQAVDATLPAIAGGSDRPVLKSTARLKLRVTEDQERTPRATDSTRTLLWVAGLALLAILAGGGALLALRPSDSSTAREEPPALPSAPPAHERREPREPSPPAAEAVEGSAEADEEAPLETPTPSVADTTQAGRGRKNVRPAKARAASAKRSAVTPAVEPTAKEPVSAVPAPPANNQAPSEPVEEAPEPSKAPASSAPDEAPEPLPSELPAEAP